MLMKTNHESQSMIQPDERTEPIDRSAVIRLGSATKLTLGGPGKKNKDGKYFFTK